VFTVVFFLTSRVFPIAWSVLPGSLGTAAVLLTEAGLFIMGLGGVFERFDLSEEVLHQG
jgi:hypothetical protein